MANGPTAATACQLTSAPPNQVQRAYGSSPGTMTFRAAKYSRNGSVAFATLSLDGHTQPLNSLAVTLGPGIHKVLFATRHLGAEMQKINLVQKG